MASPIQYMKIAGKTAGSTLVIPLANLGNVSIANAFRNIGAWFESIGIGSRSWKGNVFSGGLPAVGTVTLSSMVAADTITVNGTTFTAETSGASGNQFNVGADDTATAANAAAAINASATAIVVNNVIASSSGAVLTVTAVESGTIGNLMTLAVSAHGTAVSPTGGTDGTLVALAKGL